MLIYLYTATEFLKNNFEMASSWKEIGRVGMAGEGSVKKANSEQ
jgi:hypothetical protein